MDVQNARPNGAATAAVLAAGLATLTLGLMTVGSEVSAPLHDALIMSSGVGPLSGKTIVATLVYFVAWGALHASWSGKDVDFGRWLRVTYLLIAIGFVLTFPPVFLLFG